MKFEGQRRKELVLLKYSCLDGHDGQQGVLTAIAGDVRSVFCDPLFHADVAID
jgi:hypothetical protein